MGLHYNDPSLVRPDAAEQVGVGAVLLLQVRPGQQYSNNLLYVLPLSSAILQRDGQPSSRNVLQFTLRFLLLLTFCMG